MTLAELQEHVNRMVARAAAAGMNPEKMVIKVWGEHGEPRRIEAQHIVDNESLSLTARVQ